MEGRSDVADDAMWTIAVSLGAGACIGGLLGALAALLWRARRESALRVEVETLRARLKTDDVVKVELPIRGSLR